jgi:hypothetical protein
MGCDSRPRACAKPLVGRYAAHLKIKRAEVISTELETIVTPRLQTTATISPQGAWDGGFCAADLAEVKGCHCGIYSSSFASRVWGERAGSRSVVLR